MFYAKEEYISCFEGIPALYDLFCRIVTGLKLHTELQSGFCKIK